jgi:hypothetical protein
MNPDTNFIEFKKVRNINEKVNVTFEFIRQNLRPLFNAILYIAVPFFCLAGIAQSIMKLNFQNLIQSNFSFSLFSEAITTYLVTGLLCSSVIIGVVNSYIYVYIQKRSSKIEVDEVWQVFKSKIAGIILFTIGLMLILSLALILFIIPGIFLSIPLSLIFYVYFFENKNFFDAVGRCMAIIKDKWFSTFGLLMIMVILHSILSFLFGLPVAFIEFWKAFSTIEDGTRQPLNTSSVIGILDLIFTTVQVTGTYIMYSVVLIALAFQYFNLVEIKEATGLLEKISTIGKKTIIQENEQEVY